MLAAESWMRKNIFAPVFALVFSLIFPNLLHGTEESCSPYHLDKNGGPFEKIQVYDQAKNADLNICYAIAAASLIDAQRIFEGDALALSTSPISIHSLHLLEYEKELDVKKFFDTGGDIKNAINAATGQFVCDQNYLEKVFPIRAVSPAIVNDPRSKESVIGDFLKAIDARADVENTKLKDIDDALDIVCRHNQIKIDSFLVEQYNVWTKPWTTDEDYRKNLMLKIKEVTNLNPKAIGIAWNPIFTRFNKLGIANHASVIIGRRLLNDRCELLVRDSYGLSCAPNTIYPCENGSMWIPEDILIKNTRSLTWIPDRKH